MICKNKKSELEEFFLEFEYTVCYVSRRSNIDH